MTTMPNVPTRPKSPTGTPPPCGLNLLTEKTGTAHGIAKIDGMTDQQRASAFNFLTGALGVALNPKNGLFTPEKITELFNDAVDYGRTQ